MRRALLFALLCSSGCYEGRLEQGLTLTCTTNAFCPNGHECSPEGRCVTETQLLENPAVSPSHLKVGTTLIATFGASAALKSPTVVLIDVKGRTLVELEQKAGPPDYRFEATVPGGLEDGPAVVRADLTTAGGVSLGHKVGEVTLDFEDPQVTPLTRLLPGPGNPLAAPTELRAGTTLEVVAAASEPLRPGGTGVLVPCDGGSPTLSLVEELTGAQVHTWRGTVPDGGMSDGCHVVQLEIADLAGNAVLIDAGTVVVDRVSPPPPDTAEGLIVYRRAPSGEQLSSRDASYSLQVSDGGFPADTFMVVTLPSGAAPIIAPQPATAGTYPLPLEGDSPVVFVAAADRAGNVSPRVFVRDVEWVGFPYDRSPEVQVQRRAADTPAFRQANSQVAVLDGMLSTVEPAASWREVSQDEQIFTGPRVDHAAFACDDERRVCILFGGKRVDQTASSETWRWDGEGWAQLPITGPEARIDAAMAFDRTRRAYVLVGGFGAHGNVLNDVWVLSDESSWARGPSPADGGVAQHAMTYDAARRRVQLFAGRLLWELPSATGVWELTTSTMNDVQPRVGQAMVYDELSRRTLIIGGKLPDAGELPSEQSLLIYDGTLNEFRRQPAPPRAHHGAAYDPATGEVTIVRGINGTTPQTDCQRWTVDGGWRPVANCTIGWAPTETWAVAFSQPEGVIVHGSPNSPGAATTWLVPADGGAAVALATAVLSPLGRWRHTMTRLPLGDVMTVGGNTGFDEVLDEARAYDQLGWTGGVTRVALPVESHVAGVRGSQLFVMGGVPDASFAQRFDGQMWQPAPFVTLARQQHSGANVGNGDFVVFGGGEALADGGFRYEPDTLLLPAGGTWQTLTAAPQPPPRRRAAMVTLLDGGALLFGGLDPQGEPLGDTWVFGASGWSQLADAGPRPRSGHALATDAHGKVVLFGGELEPAGPVSDTWEFVDGQWSRLELEDPEGDQEPAVRRDSAMALGPRNHLVLFGGGTVNRSLYNDMFELRRHEAAQLITFSFDGIATPRFLDPRLVRLDVRAQAYARLSNGSVAGITPALWSDGAFRVCDTSMPNPVDEVRCIVGREQADRLARLSLRRDLGVLLRPVARYPVAAAVTVGPVRVQLRYRLEGNP